MSNVKPKRKQLTYQHKKNAVHVTVYSLTGDTIPAEVRKEIEESVWKVASTHQLVINIALT